MKKGTAVTLSDDVREFLSEQPSASAHVEEVIRKSAAFKKWLAAKGNSNAPEN